MKIEITNEQNGYFLYEEKSNRPIQNFRSHIVGRFTFYEDDIYNLIGEKNYKKFEEGKYIFEVPKSQLNFITGERSARTRGELLMYND